VHVMCSAHKGQQNFAHGGLSQVVLRAVSHVPLNDLIPKASKRLTQGAGARENLEEDENRETGTGASTFRGTSSFRFTGPA
jgi:hypothetical protein